MAISRLFLVVAPQNAAMGYLSGLEGAAHDVAEVLEKDTLGHCSPALVGESALLYGTEVTQARIEAAARTAIRRAGELGATLIFAFLGHGITPPGRSQLYMMGADARPDMPSTAVNVGNLIIEAAEQPGCDGVVGLIDASHAAAAMPEVKALMPGASGGRTRVSLLMASEVDQAAYDLVFSRRLAELLRRGLPGAGSHLGVSELAKALRHVVTGQDVVSLEHDGGHSAEQGLWLSRNSRHAEADRPGPDTFGAEELRSALGRGVPGVALDDLPAVPLDSALLARRIQEASRLEPFTSLDQISHEGRGDRKDYARERIPISDGGQADVFLAIHKASRSRVAITDLQSVVS